MLRGGGHLSKCRFRSSSSGAGPESLHSSGAPSDTAGPHITVFEWWVVTGSTSFCHCHSQLELPQQILQTQGLKWQNFISPSSGGRKAKTKVPARRGPLRPLSLACGRPPPLRVLSSVLLVFLLLPRTPVLMDRGPTLMTPFNLNYLLNGPICKFSHINN